MKKEKLLNMIRESIEEHKKRPSNDAMGIAYEIMLAKHVKHIIHDPEGNPEEHYPEHADGKTSTKEKITKIMEKHPEHVFNIDNHAKQDAIHVAEHIRKHLGPEISFPNKDIKILHTDNRKHVGTAIGKEDSESPADFIVSHGNKHIGISAKYGNSTSARTTTLRQTSGAISKQLKDRFERLKTRGEKIIKTNPDDKKFRKSLRKTYAHNLAKDFNALNLENKKRAIHKYTNTLRTDGLTDIKVERNPKEGVSKITYPVGDMENHLSTVSDIYAQYPGKGQTVRFYSQHHGGIYNQFASVKHHHFSSIGFKTKRGVPFDEVNTKISKNKKKLKKKTTKYIVNTDPIG